MCAEMPEPTVAPTSKPKAASDSQPAADSFQAEFMQRFACVNYPKPGSLAVGIRVELFNLGGARAALNGETGAIVAVRSGGPNPAVIVQLDDGKKVVVFQANAKPTGCPEPTQPPVKETINTVDGQSGTLVVTGDKTVVTGGELDGTTSAPPTACDGGALAVGDQVKLQKLRGARATLNGKTATVTALGLPLHVQLDDGKATIVLPSQAKPTGCTTVVLTGEHTLSSDNALGSAVIGKNVVNEGDLTITNAGKGDTQIGTMVSKAGGSVTFG